MPYTPPIVGYITAAGYVRCVDCAVDKRDGWEVVGGTYHGIDGEPCEVCGLALMIGECGEMRTDGYQHVEVGGPRPEIAKSNPYHRDHMGVS